MIWLILTSGRPFLKYAVSGFTHDAFPVILPAVKKLKAQTARYLMLKVCIPWTGDSRNLRTLLLGPFYIPHLKKEVQ